MDSEQVTSSKKILFVGASASHNSESEYEMDLVDSSKENRRYITPAQSKSLFLFMNDRVGFAKGKMKSTNESEKFLDEWNQLVFDLNALGPPCHSSSKWRRVWTGLKSKSKRKLSDVSVLRSQDQNKRVKDQRLSACSSTDHRTSSVKNRNAISTNGDVKTEISSKIDLLESMSKKVDSFMKNQALFNGELAEKMDRIIEQQEKANVANDKLIKASEILSDIFCGDINI